MKALPLLALLLFGCAGMHVPRYQGPALAQDNWLSACPQGEHCIVAEWHEPRNGVKVSGVCDFCADYTQSEWHCPRDYWYASWIGMSDTWQNPSRIPMLCVERKTFEQRHVLKCPSGIMYGKDGAEAEYTPVGYGLWMLGIDRLFNPRCKVVTTPKGWNYAEPKVVFGSSSGELKVVP